MAAAGRLQTEAARRGRQAGLRCQAAARPAVVAVEGSLPRPEEERTQRAAEAAKALRREAKVRPARRVAAGRVGLQEGRSLAVEAQTQREEGQEGSLVAKGPLLAAVQREGRGRVAAVRSGRARSTRRLEAAAVEGTLAEGALLPAAQEGSRHSVRPLGSRASAGSPWRRVSGAPPAL